MILRLAGFFLVLGVITFVHELGHYLIARLSKVRVEEFGMGYPPRLVKLFRFQGTDFTLNWIPFGGFARLKGLDEEDAGSDSFTAASGGRKIAILIAGSVMNLLLACFCFALTYRVGVPVAVGLPELSQVPAQSVAAGYALAPGDILLDVNGTKAQITPFTASRVRLQARAPSESPTGQIALMRDGELVSLPVAETATPATVLAGTEHQAVLGIQIGRVVAGSPAEAAGLQAGDRIYSLAGSPFYLQMEDLVHLTSRHLGQQVPLVVLRDGRFVTTQVVPRPDPPAGEGPLGVTIRSVSEIGYVRAPYFLALGMADTLMHIRTLATLPAQIIRGQADPADAALIGPVGIAGLVGDAVEVTTSTGLWLPILRLSGALSSALAVINLLPIPALDGGRLLFVVVEMVRRKRIEPSREKLVHVVGMALLLLMMVFITIQDVTSPQPGIDWYEMLGR